MDIIFTTRQFYPEEQQLLKILKKQKQKGGISKIKFYHFLTAGFSGAGFTYLATLFPDSFWTFLFGTVAILLFAFIVFTPYEMYKQKRRHNDFLQLLNTTVEKGTVNTCLINATRIAIAVEYEDEGDLFIIEFDKEKILYLWDYDFNLRKKFPCLAFEIYEDKFCKLFNRQVYPISNLIKPLTIDKKAKWNYLRKFGAPGHLQTDNKNFDKLIEEFNSCA